MSTKGTESKWVIMTQQTIHATQDEWAYAKNIMQTKIANGEQPPFKIPHHEPVLNHSFLVAIGENGKPILGAIARGKDHAEGILGFGTYGVCKLVLWEDGQKCALKIEPDNQDQTEVDIMSKLGLIRALFKREWEKREAEHASKPKASVPSQKWIRDKEISGKLYKAMPLIEGVDLEKYLISINFSPSMVSQRIIAVSLVKELMALHSKHIIHNDIHTNNIMVDDKLNAYLIDYGKSHDMTITKLPAIVAFSRTGREDTLAPEVIDFKTKIKKAVKNGQINEDDLVEIPTSPASDIYALAGIFKEQFLTIQGATLVRALIDDMQKKDPQERIDLNEILTRLESPAFLQLIQSADAKQAPKPPKIVASSSNVKEGYYDESIGIGKENKRNKRPTN